jgi:hypothetical protein
MTKIIVAKNKIDCSDLVGNFVDESHYDILVEEDTDCYLPADCDIMTRASCQKTDCNDCEELNPRDEKRIGFIFRKNWFTQEEQDQAYIGLKGAARASQNRGLAAGPKGAKLGGRDWVTVEQISILDYFCKLNKNVLIDDHESSINIIRNKNQNKNDTRGLVWLSSEVEKNNFNFDQWLTEVIKKPNEEIIKEAKWVTETFISDTTYANAVLSGVAGWFDRYPRIPYGRATAYTRDHFDKFQLAFPFLQSLNRGFKELLPWRWSNQKAAADKIDSRFLVPETVFTTVTVNSNFRTAAHYDAGDLNSGLSNLLVVSNGGKYKGGYLILPEYRVAVNVRPGDLLLINNHEVLHGNTPIELEEEGAERISLVCYFREKMLELGSYEYENIRFEYVESRRKNTEHLLWKPLWNGISEGMWEEGEWYGYLEKHGGREMLEKYHPEVKADNNVKSTLESLFG